MKKKLIFAICLLLSFSVLPAYALDNKDVTAGETVIVNISEVVSEDFTYEFLDGKTTVLKKGYVTKDDYSLGETRHNSRGNEVFVYCLEHMVDGYTWNSRLVATESGTSDTAWKEMSAEQRRGVSLALLYGYPNLTYGASKADAFAATQAVIWEFQSGVRNSTSVNSRRAVTYRYRTDGSGTKSVKFSASRFYDIIDSHSGAVKAYNGIISNIYAKPDFGSSLFTLSYDNFTSLYTVTLTDKNGVLSLFDVTCDGATVSVSGNNLTLSSSSPVSGKLTLKRKAIKREGQAMLILTASPFGQSMILGSKDVDTTFSYNFVSEPAHKITVTKKGEVLSGFAIESGVFAPIYTEEMLSDCTINVYDSDGTLVDSLVTSKDGPVSTRQLSPGTYTLREFSAPSGYLNSSDEIVVTLSSSDSLVSLTNSRPKCALTFKKTFSSDVEAGALSSVSFGVYNAEEILDLPADSLLEIIRPDEDGNCSMTVDLPYGYDYYLKEISTAESCVLSEDIYTFSFKDLDPLLPVFTVDLGEIENTLIPVEEPEEPEEPEPEEEEVIAVTGDDYLGFKVLLVMVFAVFVLLIDFIGYKFYNLFV